MINYIIHLKFVKKIIYIQNLLNFIKKIKPTIVVVISYGQIIPKEFLELSKNGFLNIHASILPKFRGAAPIQRSIMSGENITCLSFNDIE